MTVRQLLTLVGQHPAILLGLAAVPPVVALILGALHAKGNGGAAPWRHIYAVLVYAVAFPGMAAAVVTAYMLFFSRENLLDANLLVHFGPIASMAATLLIIRKNVSFDEVPGFHRLSGLMTLIGVTFVILLAIKKTFIGLFFGGSIAMLAGAAVFLFALLKWGSDALFRRRDEPRVKPPSFPGT